MTETTNCIFCKIINGDIPCNKIYEDDELIAFYDISPSMPMHFLIIPKQHISMLSDIPDIKNENENENEHKYTMLLGKMLLLAPSIANKIGCSNFKIGINNGKAAGQEVFHLHMHVMGNFD
jgi:histidine triad (HIT) family protein